MFSIRVYVIVAAGIALLAFGIGQIVPGMGMIFVAAASLLWTAWSVSRARRIDRAG